MKGDYANAHQRQMIHRVLTQGRKMRAKNKVMRAALVTITQESTATNLPGGDGSSVGLFQIISIHGSWERRHNPEWASRWFLTRAIRVHRQRPTLSIGRIAQAVQASAHPGAYAAWKTEATRTYARWLRGCLD